MTAKVGSGGAQRASCARTPRSAASSSRHRAHVIRCASKQRPLARVAAIVVEKRDQRFVAIARISAERISHSFALLFLASSRRNTVNP